MKFKNGLTVRSNMEDMFQNDYKGYPVCVETDQGMLIFLPSIFKFNNIYIYIYIYSRWWIYIKRDSKIFQG